MKHIVFEPRPDITVFELALIVGWLAGSITASSPWGVYLGAGQEPPEGTVRHFREVEMPVR